MVVIKDQERDIYTMDAASKSLEALEQKMCPMKSG